MNGEQAINTTWLLMASGLVFIMQAGFACLECGLTRTKNSINVAIKNLTDFGISSLTFWIFGYAVMFGASWKGLIGTEGFLLPFDEHGPLLAAFFLFQLMFCGTSTTIVSGAVAERMRFSGYVAVAAVLSGVIYTVFGHWAWGGNYPGSSPGWLQKIGFVDFAGSSVVHSVGAWTSLAGVLIVGARHGRFPKDGPPRRIQGHSIPMSVLGVMLLWFGWFGFNGGSTLAMNEQVPRIVANTSLAAATGMIGALALAWRLTRRPDVAATLNGCLGGLVAITANCHAVTAVEAAFIGLAGGVIVVLVDRLLERLRVDDAVSAIPVHGACGVWGTLAVGIFGDPKLLGTGLGTAAQIAVQALGAAVCFAWAFGTGYLLLRIINRFIPLRVSTEDEQTGLNVSEHGESTEIHDLLTTMDHHARTGDLKLRAPVEPFTEIGQIAGLYNHVLEALHRAVVKTEAIVKTATDGILTFDRREHKILSVNPSAETMFSSSADLLVGRPVFSLLAMPDGGHLSVLPEPSAPSVRRELTGVRRDGSNFPVELTVAHAGDDGAGFYAATVRDISERKRYELELQSATKAAQEASGAKSQFLASMSHELRTPLNAIIGYSEMLQEECADQNHGDLIPDLGKISTAGRHLLRLINDVLDLSKIEAGKMELFVEETSVETLVHEVQMTVQPLVEKNQNTLTLTLADGLGTMRTDVTRLRQCLFNLLGNAVKFTRNGKIGLDVGRRAMDDREWVIFRVSDTGVGVPPEKLAKLFQPFTQADASTARIYGGTGLGLSITKRFCEMMDGSLEIQSVPGEGTTVTLRLPAILAKPEAGAPVAPQAPAPRSGGADVVLVVDDDPIARDLLARALVKEGYQVAEAADGQEALRKVRELMPVAVTLDVLMPGMDGWAVLRRLKEDPDVAHIPVIMVSMVEDRGLGFALGVSDYLTKPIDHHCLAAILKKHRCDHPPCPILIIEDDPDALDLMTRSVRGDGWRVSTAQNGAEGLERVAAERPTVILLDLMLPVMDGFEFLRRLRQEEAWRTIPIVVITAKVLTEEDRRQLSGCVSRILQKGALQKEEFLKEVRDLVRSCVAR